MSIKTVIFAPNTAGITAMDIDTEKWVIKSTCAHLTGYTIALAVLPKVASVWSIAKATDIRKSLLILNP